MAFTCHEHQWKWVANQCDQATAPPAISSFQIFSVVCPETIWPDALQLCNKVESTDLTRRSANRIGAFQLLRGSGSWSVSSRAAGWRRERVRTRLYPYGFRGLASYPNSEGCDIRAENSAFWLFYAQWGVPFVGRRAWVWERKIDCWTSVKCLLDHLPQNEHWLQNNNESNHKPSILVTWRWG